jgi:hypothetical protein
MLSHKAANETPNLTSGAGIKLITKLNKPVTLLVVDANHKLTVFGFAFLFTAHQKPPTNAIGASLKQITTK